MDINNPGYKSLEEANEALIKYCSMPIIVADNEPAYHIIKLNQTFGHPHAPDDRFIRVSDGYLKELNKQERYNEETNEVIKIEEIKPLITFNFETNESSFSRSLGSGKNNISPGPIEGTQP